MIEKTRLQRISSLAIPIIGGMMSQNILNLVDTYMVGFLGDAALAAVGLGGFANFMCQAIILGISVGVQATAARRKGEGRHDETAAPLNAALLVVLVSGLVLSVVLFFLAPLFYPYLNGDPEVIEVGVPYLQSRIAAIVFVGINFSFRGYWNGTDRPWLYMQTLIAMHATNIVLNYMLIFGNWGAPELGVLGAGMATSISTAIGTMIYFGLGFVYARENGFFKSMPTRDGIVRLIKLSIPNSIQQLFFSAGFTATYWIIGKVGTAELAAASVLLNITMVAYLPALALGLSSSTLVGQALGRNEPNDAHRWGWDVSIVGAIGIGLIGLPMVFMAEWMLSIFLHEPATVALGVWPLRLVGISISIDAIGMILMHSLLGSGATKWVMRVSVGLQWGFFLPMAFLLGPVLGYGLLSIWLLQTGYRGVQAVIFMMLWNGKSWVGIKV